MDNERTGSTEFYFFPLSVPPVVERISVDVWKTCNSDTPVVRDTIMGCCMGTISNSGHTMSYNDTLVLPMSSRCWSADRTTTNPNILKKGE